MELKFIQKYNSTTKFPGHWGRVQRACPYEFKVTNVDGDEFSEWLKFIESIGQEYRDDDGGFGHWHVDNYDDYYYILLSHKVVTHPEFKAKVVELLV